MATSNSSKRPVTTLRYGNITATIWQNVSENGISLGLNDLEALMNVAFEAKERMTAHTLNRFSEKPPALRGLPYFAYDFDGGVE